MLLGAEGARALFVGAYDVTEIPAASTLDVLVNYRLVILPVGHAATPVASRLNPEARETAPQG